MFDIGIIECAPFVAAWSICGLVAAILFRSKGQAAPVSLFRGLLLGPLGILIALAAKSNRDIQPSGDRTKR